MIIRLFIGFLTIPGGDFSHQQYGRLLRGGVNLGGLQDLTLRVHEGSNFLRLG